MNFENKNILVTDDEPIMREILCDLFQNLGCITFEASNGKEAYNIAMQNQIDVVISDIRMPGGSGVELLENLRAKHPSQPIVILISGYSDLSMEDALKKGAQSMISKPFDRKSLLTTIEKYLS